MGYGLKSMWPTFKTQMLSVKGELELEVLFGKSIHHLNPEIRKMLERGKR